MPISSSEYKAKSPLLKEKNLTELTEILYSDTSENNFVWTYDLQYQRDVVKKILNLLELQEKIPQCIVLSELLQKSADALLRVSDFQQAKILYEKAIENIDNIVITKIEKLTILIRANIGLGMCIYHFISKNMRYEEVISCMGKFMAAFEHARRSIDDLKAKKPDEARSLQMYFDSKLAIIFLHIGNDAGLELIDNILRNCDTGENKIPFKTSLQEEMALYFFRKRRFKECLEVFHLICRTYSNQDLRKQISNPDYACQGYIKYLFFWSLVNLENRDYEKSSAFLEMAVRYSYLIRSIQPELYNNILERQSELCRQAANHNTFFNKHKKVLAAVAVAGISIGTAALFGF